jgi:hypothetical protein
MELKFGICKGTSVKEKGNGIIEHYILVVSEGKDEFGQTVDVTTGIRIGKAHMEAGVGRIWDQFIDKQVAVPFFAKAWKSKAGNVGLERWLTGEGKPIALEIKKPPQAA